MMDRQRLEAPDHERAISTRLLRELEARRPLHQRPQSRLELDPRQRRADADVDAAAEADVLGGVGAADLEGIRARRTRVGPGSRTPKSSATFAPRGTGSPPSSTPSSSTHRSNSWSGGSQRISSSTAAAASTSPPTSRSHCSGWRQQRADAVAERVHGRLVAGVQQHDDRRDELVVGEPPPSTVASTSARDQVVARLAAALPASETT